MSSYIESNLLTGERILMRSKLHPIIFWIPIVWTLFTIVLTQTHSMIILLAYITALAAVGSWVSTALEYYTSEFAITNKRVIVKKGFIRRNVLELFLQKIEGINIHQGIFGRLFNFGTLVVIGTGGTQNPFASIDNPLPFRKKVQEQIELALRN